MQEVDTDIDEFDTDERELEAKRQAKLSEDLNELGSRLIRLAEEQVKKKEEIEDRWLDDLRNYHGVYDSDTAKKLKDSNSSSIFVNITRHKTNAGESRLIDMLFPNDDKNWSIKPTPDPQIKPIQTPGDMQQVEDIAKAASKAMERKIEDQLIEADYNAKCRDMIHDAAVLGTGIMKGPVVELRTSKKWIQNQDEAGNQVHVLQIVEELEPTFEVVSPWDFFPDMSARNLQEAEFVFERREMTRQQAQDLIGLPGILNEQVISILKSEQPETISNDRRAEIKEISGDGLNSHRKRYELWEYHGPITREELEAAGMMDLPEDLIEVNGTIMILGNKVIRASINPLDTEELPYSVFNWEKDNSGIFGYGIPYLVNSPQKVINASMRMMMDNAALSTGPQVVVRRKGVRPANGSWSLSPRKVWYAEDSVPINEVFGVFSVNSNQAELANIYQLGRGLIDEQSSLPPVATGEGDPNAAPQTATGVAISSGAAKVTFKRVVKNFDDDNTRPNIRRLYDYNMQYSKDQSIKGDFQVNARGSSTLMTRDIESKALVELVPLTTHPVLGPMINGEELLRDILKSRQVDSTTVMKSHDEIEELQKKQAQMNPQIQLEQAKLEIEHAKLAQKQSELQLQAQKIQMEAELKQQELYIKHQLEMEKIAAQNNISLEQLRQKTGSDVLNARIKQMEIETNQHIEQIKNDTTRQIGALRVQQENNKQALQAANIAAGHDTFS